MGLLTKLKTGSLVVAPSPAAASVRPVLPPSNLPPKPPPIKPAASAGASQPTASPCKICGSPVFWESVARDGKLRCERCEPSPSDALVARRLTIVIVNDCPAWVPLDFALAKAEERRERTARYGTPPPAASDDPARSPSLTWSKPDFAGWCYAIDCEGREHARHKSYLPFVEQLDKETSTAYAARIEQHRRLRHPDLQRLDESDYEYEERLNRMTRAAEIAEKGFR